MPKRKNKKFKDEIGGFGSLFGISSYKIKNQCYIMYRWCGYKIDIANKFKKFDTIE